MFFEKHGFEQKFVWFEIDFEWNRNQPKKPSDHPPHYVAHR